MLVVGGTRIVNTSGAGKWRVSYAQHNMFAMCRASTWQSNLREIMSAPCHHQLGTQRADQNNIGNQNLIHIEAKNNSMKEITAHENNDQQTCLSTTERKPNKAQTQTNLTKSSGTSKSHHPRTSATRWHNITCTMGCGYVFIVQCLTTLHITLNATSARTETTAHLDGDLHRHNTRTVNLVHDR